MHTADLFIDHFITGDIEQIRFQQSQSTQLRREERWPELRISRFGLFYGLVFLDLLFDRLLD